MTDDFAAGAAVTPALCRPGPRLLTDQRDDEAFLAAAWADPGSRVLVLDRGRARIERRDGLTLLLVPPAEAPNGERWFLGVDETGVAHFGVAAAQSDGTQSDAGESDGPRWAGLREVGALLPALDAGMMARAVGLSHWHRLHPFCARCGAATEPAAGGHLRRCATCSAEHFPRTDPAVIMLVTDPADRALLARGPDWPPLRHSVLAGFVEPGESLEQAVAREVAEEAGVEVVEVAYLGSQPWPFPSSLMVGFAARAANTRIAVDGAELSEARWFSRDELRDRVLDGSLLLPGPISIAHQLITRWYGDELPDTAWASPR